MSQTEPERQEPEEVIVDAEVLSESPSTDQKSDENSRWIIILLLAITLLAGLSWYLAQYFSQQIQQQSQQAIEQSDHNNQIIADLQRQLSLLSSQAQSQHETAAAFGNRLQQQQQSNEALQNRLTHDVQRQEQLIQQLLHSNREQSHQLNQSVTALARRVDRRESNIHTTTALRLLQIAEEQLMIVGDLESSHQALAQAAQQIASSGDPVLIPIQETIQQEMRQIQQTVIPDIESALTLINQAITQSQTLPFYQPEIFQPEITPVEPKPLNSWNWEAIRDKVWSDLLSLVRIEKHNQELPVIATRSEERLSRLILQLRLEQAQSALLLRNSALFRERVQHITEWLVVFDQDSPIVTKLEQQLTPLLELELEPRMPTIGEAHRRLREVVAQRKLDEKLPETTETVSTATTDEEQP